MYNNFGLLYINFHSFLKQGEELTKKALAIRRELRATAINNPVSSNASNAASSSALLSASESGSNLEVTEADVASTLNNLGMCYQTQTKHNEALPLLEEALDIFTRAYVHITTTYGINPPTTTSI